ncbi:MAG: 50S ribosomal protein L13 [Deinococcus sp.]|nr:50S ribosomal protein L13 [Deinococcus sp.]
MNTYIPEKIESKWVLIDAQGQTLGRLATRVAHVLRGKHRPTYTPHLMSGDFVVVVNAQKIRLTGKKLDLKIYDHYSGYPGGLKLTSARQMLSAHPERLIELAVWGMIPKGRMGRRIIRRLKVYAGPAHPHTAQRPEPL